MNRIATLYKKKLTEYFEKVQEVKTNNFIYLTYIPTDKHDKPIVTDFIVGSTNNSCTLNSENSLELSPNSKGAFFNSARLKKSGNVSTSVARLSSEGTPAKAINDS